MNKNKVIEALRVLRGIPSVPTEVVKTIEEVVNSLETYEPEAVVDEVLPTPTVVIPEIKPLAEPVQAATAEVGEMKKPIFGAFSDKDEDGEDD